MLETLNRYAEADAQIAAKSARSIRLPLGRRLDPRFFTILGLSIACHLAFYVGLIVLDSWFGHLPAARRRNDPEEIVKIIDLTGNPNQGPPLRTPPERMQRIDLSNLVENPKLGDDTSLVSRSPAPGSGSEDSGKKSKSGRPPGQAAASASNVATPQPGDAQNHTAQPPGARPIEMRQAPAPTQQATATLPGAQPATAPPPPSQRRPRIAGDTGSGDGNDESSGRPRELGLSVIESQYRAYVRQKIYDENRRHMPRDFITSVLANEVSADFEVVIGRDGQVKSVRMRRSCGYSDLDKTARDAIHTASPFAGYPQALGDTFTVIVTVRYTPFG